MDRRDVLAGLAAGVAGLAGCSELDRTVGGDGAGTEDGSLTPGSGSDVFGDGGDSNDDTDGEDPTDGRDSTDDASGGSGAGPETVFRSYLDALTSGDQEATDALVHEAGNAGEAESADLTVERVERVSLRTVMENADDVPPEDVDEAADRADDGVQDMLEGTGVDDYAVVAHETVYDGDTQRLHALLVLDDGEWLVYDASVGLVPSTAEPPTTDDATQQRALNVVSMVGDVAGDAVDQVRVVVAKSPGAADVDLTGLTVAFSGPDAQATLTHRGADGGFVLESITDVEGAPENELTETEQRYVVKVPLGARRVDGVDNEGVLEPLSEGDEAVLSLRTATGHRHEMALAVPETLPEDATAVRL